MRDTLPPAFVHMDVQVQTDRVFSSDHFVSTSSRNIHVLSGDDDSGQEEGFLGGFVFSL